MKYWGDFEKIKDVVYMTTFICTAGNQELYKLLEIDIDSFYKESITNIESFNNIMRQTLKYADYFSFLTSIYKFNNKMLRESSTLDLMDEDEMQALRDKMCFDSSSPTRSKLPRNNYDSIKNLLKTELTICFPQITKGGSRRKPKTKQSTMNINKDLAASKTQLFTLFESDGYYTIIKNVDGKVKDPAYQVFRMDANKNIQELKQSGGGDSESDKRLQQILKKAGIQ
jgi:hypothetical protein